MGISTRRGNQGGEILSDVIDTDTPKPSGVAGLLEHVRENPVAYMLGLLILQQAGLLGQAASQLQGVCF
jgi:hypothetical protein